MLFIYDVLAGKVADYCFQPVGRVVGMHLTPTSPVGKVSILILRFDSFYRTKTEAAGKFVKANISYALIYKSIVWKLNFDLKPKVIATTFVSIDNILKANLKTASQNKAECIKYTSKISFWKSSH